MTLAEAWHALTLAAEEYARGVNERSRNELHRAAITYAQHRETPKPRPTGVADHRTTEAVIPFGRSKGKPINEASTRDLEWVLGALEKSIDDPAKARWRDSNQATADAIRDELEGR